MPDLGSLLRVVVSLGLVLALLWVAARTLHKGRARAAGGVDVDVLARVPLAQKSSLAVVRLGDEALVLGVTESRVELLCRTSAADVTVEPETTLPELLAAVPAGSLAGSLPGSPAPSPATGAPVPVGRVAARQAARSSALAGSALSPQTWTKAVAAVREMTVRR
jgi:flagellar protein FliO/FliZ